MKLRDAVDRIEVDSGLGYGRFDDDGGFHLIGHEALKGLLRDKNTKWLEEEIERLGPYREDAVVSFKEEPYENYLDVLKRVKAYCEAHPDDHGLDDLIGEMDLGLGK